MTGWYKTLSTPRNEEGTLNMVADTPTTMIHRIRHAMHTSHCRLAGHASVAAAPFQAVDPADPEP
jgi:hypothetical protein